MNPAFLLFQLQKIDNEIDQSLARLKQIEDDLRLSPALDQASRKLDAAKADAASSSKDMLALDSQAENKKTKIQQSESALYGGKIHLPKELQDIQAEIASLKHFLSELDDQTMEAIERSESMDAAVKVAETDLILARSIDETEKSMLRAEKGNLEKQNSRLSSERNAMTGSLDVAILARYEKLRTQKHGKAVAEARDSSCAACGSGLTPSEWQQARSPAQLLECPSCGRILYAG